VGGGGGRAPSEAGGRREDTDFETVSCAPTEPLGLPPDGEVPATFMEKIGFPGQWPFTRGPYPSMYLGRLWTMRQFSGFGTALDTNRRYKYLLEQGQTGLSVAFDMPTLMGLDADDPHALGEVGRCGVAVSSLADMETLFDGIPMGEVSTSMTINGPASILWAMYIVAAEKQGYRAEQLRGTTQNDILKEYIAQKEYLFPPRPSLRLVTDTVEHAAKHLPFWHAISISGYHIREAGATAVQELAFTLADGFTYVEEAIARGLDVDDFAPRLSFFWNAHSDFFEEICKFRAARRIWAKRMRDRYQAKLPASWRLRTHAQTAGCSLTAQQPENNIVRVALQGLAAVLGGTQSLHTNSKDESLALPTEEAVKIALRTQQLVAHETGIAHTIDPLAGSWFVEGLTDRMETEAEALFQRIDKQGGVVAAIEKGWFQREIGNASYRYQKDLEAGRKTMVGVNRFNEGDDWPEGLSLLKITQATEDLQRERVRRVRAERDGAKATRAMARLVGDLRAEENHMPALLEAVGAYCTLGEIVAGMKQALGEYQEAAAV
jgi:methylmalonyl-CoA mutase N-terminal domain/subunit